MLEDFIGFIKKEKLFNSKDKILLAVSGGVDSVVLSHLFSQAGFTYAMAHCNFKLRGNESDEDELFTKKFAEKLKVKCYCTSFETEKLSETEGISIQMAARNLRYKWLEKIRSENNYKYIALAHHQDDITETLFINLIRGTGISGLHGIAPKTGNIIRPLLFSSKNNILEFTRKHQIDFREDSSNASEKYIRNKIRHQVVPVLKEINPSLNSTIASNIEHFKFAENIYLNHIKKIRKSIIKKQKNKIKISIKQTENLKNKVYYFYEFLKPYNFNLSTVNDIIKSLKKSPGKVFVSSTHRLLKDRQYLIIEKNKKNTHKQFLIDTNTRKIDTGSIILKFKITDKKASVRNIKDPSLAVFDFDKLIFPLTLRKWEKGDCFIPFGMHHKKKLSDFFIDNKIPLFEKEKILVLCSAGKIIWVVGHRINNIYKIGTITKKMYLAQIL